MSAPVKAPGSGAFAIEKAVVIGIGIVVVLFATVHVTGWVLAFVTGNPLPDFAIGRVLAAIRLRPYAAGVPPVAHAVLLIAVLILAMWLARRVRRARRGHAAATRQRAGGFDERPGWATVEAVRRVASTTALMAQARTLRPTLAKPTPADVGYLLGSSRGEAVWASSERSILVVGPPGSGKGLHLAINAILDAPGAVITTSTKPDNIKATLLARAARGTVGVFDPQGMLGNGFAHLVAWDPIDGCEDPIRAATRAEALAANTGITSSGENAVWRGHAKTVLECVLHAAALNGTSIDVSYRWMQSPHAMDTALAILENHPDACPTWDDRLRGLIHNADPRFVGSVMSVVSSAITPLSLPTVRAALTPSPTRPAVTAASLLADAGTLYALATDRGAGASAGLVSALIEDIAYVARRTGLPRV